MGKKIDIPEKQRKHRWVTEAIDNKQMVLSVWPSPDEMNKGKKQERFFETIVKIGNDPRVTNVRKANHEEYMIVYLFDLDPDA